MNAKLRWSMLITTSIACLILGSLESLAITVDVAPEDHTTYDVIAGASHTAVATTDVPYTTVKWYVDGVLKETDLSNGTSRTADFTHTFSRGSSSGKGYKIKAVAYDSQSNSDEDSYDLKVWSNMKDVASRPTRSVSNEMEVGGDYSISFSMQTPNSNYRITRAEIYVNGSRVASRSFSDVTSASISASGALSKSVGAAVRVVVKFTWAVINSVAKRVGGDIIDYTWDALVRGKIHGGVTCITEGNALDNSTFTYGGNSYSNSTTVRWYAGSRGGEDTRRTSSSGRYSFDNVPVGYLFDMIIKSTDHHRHGTGQYPIASKCTYDKKDRRDQIGETKWFIGGRPWSWNTVRADYPLTPKTVTAL